MPQSRPMPSIGARCHELRINDEDVTWRIVYRIDTDAIIILEVFDKKTKDEAKKMGFFQKLKLTLFPVKVEKPEGAEKEKVEKKEPEKKTSAQEIREAEKIYREGLATIKDLISPSSMEFMYDKMRVSGLLAKSFFVYAYPRYTEVNWLSPVINFDVSMDISMFIYPTSSTKIMKFLKNKVAQIESTMRIEQEKGMVADPALEPQHVRGPLGDALVEPDVAVRRRHRVVEVRDDRALEVQRAQDVHELVGDRPRERVE